jgi:hypothetical protein
MTDQSQKYKNWTEYLLIEVYYRIKLRWNFVIYVNKTHYKMTNQKYYEFI